MTARREPPADLAAEEAVIGNVLGNGRLLADIDLRPGDFYRPAHGHIWHAMIQVAVSGDIVEATAVAGQLERAGLLETVGGSRELMRLLTAGHSGNVVRYASSVADCALRRRLIATVAGEVVEPLYDRSIPVADTIARTLDAVQAVPIDVERSSWSPIDLTGHVAGGVVTIPATILARTDGAGLIYPGRVHWLSGEPGHGKSWIALAACVQQMEQGRFVVYIDYEDSESGVVNRLLALGANPDDIVTRFVYLRPTEPLGAHARALDADLAELRPSLIVIDGVSEAMGQEGLNPEANQDVVTWMQLLPRRLTRCEAAVLALDHVTKNKDTRGRWAIGGQHKLAGIDGAAFMVEATRPIGPGIAGVTRLDLTKDRHGTVQGKTAAGGHTIAWFKLDATNPLAVTWTLEPPRDPHDTQPAASVVPVDKMEKVWRFVHDVPGVTASLIHGHVKGRKEWTLKAIAKLTADGHLIATPAGRNGFTYVAGPEYRAPAEGEPPPELDDPDPTFDMENT